MYIRAGVYFANCSTAWLEAMRLFNEALKISFLQSHYNSTYRANKKIEMWRYLLADFLLENR